MIPLATWSPWAPSSPTDGTRRSSSTPRSRAPITLKSLPIQAGTASTTSRLTPPVPGRRHLRPGLQRPHRRRNQGARRSGPERLGSRRLRRQQQFRRLADHRCRRQLRLRRPGPGYIHRQRGPAKRLDTDPARCSGTYTVTVTAGGQVLSGNDFGNFQNITISGEKFNDLTGSGSVAALSSMTSPAAVRYNRAIRAWRAGPSTCSTPPARSSPPR